MKGQLGAAFISLLAAIEPILIALINIVTKAADAITQFFAAFTGTTYIRAIQAPAEWADGARGAARAAKEWKNQLLGFDEINRLNEPNNGGGSGGSNPLAGFNFADTPISAFIQSLVDKLKSGDWAGAIADVLGKIKDAILSYDWQGLGEKLWGILRDLFSSKDGAESAASAFFETLGVAFGAMVGVAWGFIRPAVEDLFTQFKNNIVDYDGNNKIGLLDVLTAIWQTKVDIWGFIWEQIVEPFARGIVEGFTGKKFSEETIGALHEAGRNCSEAYGKVRTAS